MHNITTIKDSGDDIAAEAANMLASEFCVLVKIQKKSLKIDVTV